MVGVPGKSRGCATCRRRKVKCDLRQPSCNRCILAKRTCEGYDRYPVFLVETPEGRQRRTHLEEVKPSSLTIPPQIDQGPSTATQLVLWFTATFASSPPSGTALTVPSKWLKIVCATVEPSPLLYTTLLAVSMSRFCKANLDIQLGIEGSRLYGQSLRMLEHALSSPTASLQDDVLATTALMVLYESLESRASLHTNLAGVLQLFEHRGPLRHQAELPRAILEHFRYLVMVQGLIHRRASIFSRVAWLSSPWQLETKSKEQKYFDAGLKLASLFERRDKVKGSGASQSLVKECIQLEQELAKLRSDDVPGEEIPYKVLEISVLGIHLGACVTAYGNNISSELDYLRLKGQHLAKHILYLADSLRGGRIWAISAARVMISLRLALPMLEGDEGLQCQYLYDEFVPQRALFGVFFDTKTTTTARE